MLSIILNNYPNTLETPLNETSETVWAIITDVVV